jgi:uncharacterized OB-fold protein
MTTATATAFPTLRRCTSCGKLRFYPKPLCPACHGAGSEPADASGEGTLYSFTVVHRAPSAELKAEVPYIVALVDLVEGVRVTGRLLAPEGREPQCGDRVRVTASDRPYAVFETVDAETER